MLVLALDTTTRAGSVAVVRDGRVVAELIGDPARTHGERLPLDLMKALERAGVPLDAVDLFAVAAGPGSFTGLRVGIAAMQGLAMATSRDIVPVSALDALARAGANGRDPVAVWMDAQRGQVFAALYDADAAETTIPPTSLSPERTLDRWTGSIEERTLRFIGDGAARYADEIRRRLGNVPQILATPPLAGIIGLVAASAPDKAVHPHAIVPIYIRQSDAELAQARPVAENE